MYIHPPSGHAYRLMAYDADLACGVDLYLHTYVHTYIHTYIHTHISDTYIHTYTHTHHPTTRTG
jgi:hypothetical protein